MMLLFSIPV